jgi:hypothetical protein
MLKNKERKHEVTVAPVFMYATENFSGWLFNDALTNENI